jgi:hypothetical protein
MYSFASFWTFQYLFFEFCCLRDDADPKDSTTSPQAEVMNPARNDEEPARIDQQQVQKTQYFSAESAKSGQFRSISAKSCYPFFSALGLLTRCENMPV